jgi:hypothetical protein
MPNARPTVKGGILKAARALDIISPEAPGQVQQGRCLQWLLRISDPKFRAETWLWWCCGSTVSERKFREVAVSSLRGRLKRHRGISAV